MDSGPESTSNGIAEPLTAGQTPLRKTGEFYGPGLTKVNTQKAPN